VKRGFIETHYIAWQVDSLGYFTATRMDNVHRRSLRYRHGNRRIAPARRENGD